MKSHELAKMLLSTDDVELFIVGWNDTGIIRSDIRHTEVKKTGSTWLGEVERIWEETNDKGIPAIILCPSESKT